MLRRTMTSLAAPRLPDLAKPHLAQPGRTMAAMPDRTPQRITVTDRARPRLPNHT